MRNPPQPRLIYSNTWPLVGGYVLEGLCVSRGMSLVGRGGHRGRGRLEVSKAHTIAI